MERKIPMRTCIVCKSCKEKRQLIRIVKSKEGIFIDKTGKADGRGAYVCQDKECMAKLKKGKFLNRAFSCEVPDEVYTSLLEDCFGKEK